MKTIQTILVAVLIAQLLFAGGLYYSKKAKAVVRPEGALVEFDSAGIDRIEIEDQQGKVVLARSDNGWGLPEYGDLPVQSSKVSAVLDSLNGVKTGWAVATRASSHPQLEVAEDDFTRRVKLSSDEQIAADVFIGTSPGLRRSHARRAGNDEVYAIAINSYDLPADRSQWLAKDILSTEAEIDIVIEGNTLQRVDGEWKLTDAEGIQQNAKQDSAEDLVSAVKTLRVLDIADDQPDDATETTLMTTAGDQTLTYTFLADNGNYIVRRSDIDSPFKITRTVYEKLAEFDVTQLLPDVEDSAADSDDSAEVPDSESGSVEK
ncbi:hypothetical protein AB833_29615 [Chromatiales bacterium (ex Bugula neritina AB1)]|nr:hypothetical protein AB833_29615 [Chromatiales bacterium (ex Bugula neritina AB1)]